MQSGRRIALFTGLAAAVAGLVAAPSPAPSRAAQPACIWSVITHLPAGRYAQAASYDPVSRLDYVYGGANQASNVTADLYRIDLTASTLAGVQASQISLAAEPPRRWGHTATLRRGRDGRPRVYWIGGNSADPTGPVTPATDAVLVFTPDGLGLDTLHPGGTMPPRQDHVAALDPVSGAIVVQGGRAANNSETVRNDTQFLVFDPATDAATWVAGPDGPALFGHSMIYEPVLSRMLAYGGTADGFRASGTLWELDLSSGVAGAQWRVVTVAEGPRARFDHAAAFDPERMRLVVTGGALGLTIGNAETWSLGVASPRSPFWTDLATTAGERIEGQMFFDPSHAAMVVLGGRTRNLSTVFDDVQALTCGDAPAPTGTTTAGPRTPTPTGAPASPTGPQPTTTFGPPTEPPATFTPGSTPGATDTASTPVTPGTMATPTTTTPVATGPTPPPEGRIYLPIAYRGPPGTVGARAEGATVASLGRASSR